MKEAFVKTHPMTNLVFFASVILFSMFIMQPVCLGISLVCAACTAVFLNGKKTLLFCLRFLLPAVVLIIIINPLFNHRGATVITYLPWGNPLTLESVLYGCASAAMISAVTLWFSCFNTVMTSDKIIYLFGRIAPSFSLVLAMSLRFVPRFFEQFRQVKEAQLSLYGEGKKTLFGHFKRYLRVFSTVLSMSMENAIETSDSMKSRGYGSKRRTAFSIIRFNRLDLAALCVMAAEITALLTLSVGRMSFRYFPSIKGVLFDGYAVVFYLIYAFLMLTPLLLSAKEGIQWKLSQSRI